jgi:Dolichyl-phosphate-mannose-protein mannosyltransferase
MRPAGRLATALVAGVVLLHVGLSLLSMRAKSPTFDEVAYLPAGYMQLTQGDFRLMSEHPPLLKSLAALPLLSLRVHVEDDDHAWARRRYFEFGRRFLFLWNDATPLIFRARLMVVVLAAALVVTTFRWARSLFGDTVAVLAAVLCALSPDMLAHGQLVTTDVPITLLILLAVMAMQRLMERVTWTRIVVSGLLMGTALATKFSALILLPVLGVLGLAVSLSDQPIEVGLGRRHRTVRGFAPKLALVALCLAAMAVLTPVVIWAAYGFHARVTPDPAVNEAFALENERPSSEIVWRGVRAIEAGHLLPDGFLYGFLRFAKHSERRKAFLMGERSEEGWWYYFPVTFAIKTPVALVALIAVAIALSVSGRMTGSAFLWLPVVVYSAVAMGRSLNIGHRHLLPIFPFLFILAARGAVWLWQDPHDGAVRMIRRVAPALLLSWYAVSALHVHPHYLAYFNELVGGPGQGYRYLVDSNLDWGQDLPGLKAYLDRNGIPEIKLSYFGTAEPTYYGIRGERLPGHPPPESMAAAVDPGDLVAVSATNLQAVYLAGDPDAERLMRRLRRLTPLTVVGHSIFVYRADFHWTPR